VLAGIASLTALLTSSLTGCASGAARTTGPFASVGRITTELRRGVSTKADVERVLGKPNGNGTSLLPTQASPRDVWIYNDVQTGEAKQEGKVGGVPLVRVDMRQQIIFVFFDGDRFDGYLWSTHVGAATAGSR
jgi:hypothetical protein